MDLYAENILDHYRDPRNLRTENTPPPSGRGLGGGGQLLEHSADNPACGDKLTVYLQLHDDVINNITWEGEGCAISQAGMSMLSEELIGKTKDDVLQMNKDDVYEMLGVPIGPRRFKCALLCLHTVKNAIKPRSWVETVGVA